VVKSLYSQNLCNNARKNPNTYIPAKFTTHYLFIHYQCKTLNTKDARLNNRKSRIIKRKYLNRYTVVCQIDNMEITHSDIVQDASSHSAVWANSNQQDSHSINDKNPGLFQDPVNNFPGPVRSPWMFKYEEKQAFTYNIQNVVHRRKFSMKQKCGR